MADVYTSSGSRNFLFDEADHAETSGSFPNGGAVQRGCRRSTGAVHGFAADTTPTINCYIADDAFALAERVSV